jgi:acetoin utilization deacetylase AcuC-like enzyme
MVHTGIVKHARYLDHVMDIGHPESPERLKAIYAMLEDSDMQGLFEEVTAREATREELEAVHTPSYIDLVASTAGKSYFRLDMDTSTSAKSYEAALLAAGGLLELIRAVMEDRLSNGFALVRPPGHHAEEDRAMGFCLFNNVAVGARYAMRNYGLERILIIDWDVHHGNGTQNAFYSDRRVLYFSTHRYGFFYPGTGGVTEVGKEDGEGFNVNVPLSAGVGDEEFQIIFQELLKPIALEYQPQLILVSAGFDTYYDDPLGGMKVTEQGFAALTGILMEIADATCRKRLVLTLEGGYDVTGESRSVKAVLKKLAGKSASEKRGVNPEAKAAVVDRLLRRVLEVQNRYWKNL